MDFNPSPTATETLPATIQESKTVVYLPYSLVPGLDITSWSYQKAINILDKQKTNLAPVSKPVPLILVLDWGMMPLFIIISY